MSVDEATVDEAAFAAAIPQPQEPAETSFAELVAELALAYQDESAQAALMDQIVAGAIAVIPGVVSAAVELRRDDVLSAAIVQGQDLVTRLMQAQNDTGQGTCMQATTDWVQIYRPDLLTDRRWEQLAQVLRERNIPVRAVVCTPMEAAGRRIGVLTLVSDQVDFGPHHPDDDVPALARVFAAHAAVALAGQLRHADMVTALSSRDLIGQAKGILMERFQITAPAAFAMLVQASSQTNIKLRTVCEHLSATGHITVQPRRRPAQVNPPN